MVLRFKDTDYNFPSTLADIKLSQRIEFYNLHGKVLDEQAGNIKEIPDLFDREAEETQWHLDLAARTISFYADIPYETVKAEISVVDLLNIYNTDIRLMHEQEAAIELQPSYEFNGEVWHIDPPEVLPNSTMVFNEFLHSKETVRQMHAIGKSRWDALPFLCAIYLRKKDEPFDEAFCYPDSERLKLMHELPLDIALGVGFFLSGTVSIYSTISLYSEKVSPKALTPPPTSSAGDG